jgi:hypothetical protein
MPSDPQQKVTLRRPDGTLVSATPEEAERLRVLNYEQETYDEGLARREEAEEERYFSTGTQKVATALEGGLSGATVGLSNFLIDGENTQKRAEYNPGTRIVSELVGAVAPALSTGGIGAFTPAGQLSRGAAAVGRGAAEGKIAQLAIAGGVEGAVQSAGAEVGRAHLAGDPITAQSVLAAAGWGTVFGTGLGAGIGVLGRGAEKLGGKLAAEKASRTVDELLEEVGGEATTRATVLQPEQFGSLRTAVDDIRHTATRTVDDADLAMSAAQRAAAKEERAAQKLAKEAQSVEEPLPPQASASPKYAAEDLDVAQKIGKNELRALKHSGDEFLGTLTLSGDAATAAGKKATTEIRSAYRRAMAASEAGEPEALRKALDDYRAAITRHADELSPKQPIPPAMDGVVPKPLEVPAAAPPQPKPTSPLLDEWIDTATSANVAASSKALKDVTELKSAIRELKHFPSTVDQFMAMTGARAERQFAAIDQALKAGGTEMEGFKQALTRAADEISLATGVTAEGAPVERLRASWSALRQASSKKVAESTKKAVEAARSSEHSNNLIHRIIKQASSRWASSTSKGLGAGAFLSSSAYQTAGAIAGAAVGGPAGAGILAEVTGVRAAVQQLLRQGVAKYGPGAARVAGKAAPQANPMAIRIDGTRDDEGGSKQEMFKRRSEEIRHAAVTGNDTLFRAVQPFAAAGFGDFAAELHKNAVAMLSALAEKLPRDPGDQFAAGRSLWDPDEVELLTFERYYDAFHDLIGTARRALEEGDITVEAADALKTFAPDLYNEMRVSMMERIATDEEFAESLSYEDQADLSILCELELHSTFRTDWIVEQQAMFDERQEPLKMGPPSPSASGPGRPPGPAGGTAAQMITER